MAINPEITDELLKECNSRIAEFNAEKEHQEPVAIAKSKGDLQSAIPCLKERLKDMDNANQGLEQGIEPVRDHL